MQTNITTTCTRHRHQPRRWSLRYLGSLLALYRQRRHLAGLDDNALADIGLTKFDAKTEANRPIWDVPSDWAK